MASEFYNEKKKLKKQCKPCRDVCKAASKKRRERCKNAVVTDLNTKQCNTCLYIKPLTFFKIKKDGCTKKSCEQCCIVFEKHRKKLKLEEPDRIKQYEKTRYKKRQSDPVKWDNVLKNSKKMYNKHKTSYRNRLQATKDNAISRNIEFNLDLENAKVLFESCCFYCGQLDLKMGIDRFDNLKGYSVENARSCCSVCNYAKSDWSFASFVLLMSHIAAFNGKKGVLNFNFLAPNKKPTKYVKLVWKCNNKNRECLLNETEYIAITQQNCYLCGRKGPNGIDRIDTLVGYTLDNSKPCCAICNRAKWNSLHTLFLTKCEAIFTRHQNVLIDVSVMKKLSRK
jgi:hypothetical protein